VHMIKVDADDFEGLHSCSAFGFSARLLALN